MRYLKNNYLKIGQYEILNDCVIGFITQCVSVGDETSLALHGVDMDLARKVCRTSLTEREHLTRSNYPLIDIVFYSDVIEQYLDENADKDSVPTLINSRYADLYHAALRVMTKNLKDNNGSFLTQYGLTRELTSRIRYIPSGLYTGLISHPEPLAKIVFRADIIKEKLEQSFNYAGHNELCIESARLGASVHMVELLYGVSRYAYRELRTAHSVPKVRGRPRALSESEMQKFNALWKQHNDLDFEARLIASTKLAGCTMIRAWNYMISVTVDVPPDKMTKSDLEQLKNAWMYETPRNKAGVAA